VTRRFIPAALRQRVRRDAIIESWGGGLTHEAIGETVRLAREALLTHIDDLKLTQSAV